MPSPGILVGSTNHKHSGRTKQDRLLIGERVLALRNEGFTIPMLVRELGVSKDTVYRCMQLALDQRITPKAEEFRKQQNDRLDKTQRDLSEQMEAATAMIRLGMVQESPSLIRDGMNARNATIGLQLRLDERRAKLNGLDAPVRVEATIEQIDPREQELAEMVREAQARMAAEGVQS